MINIQQLFDEMCRGELTPAQVHEALKSGLDPSRNPIVPSPKAKSRAEVMRRINEVD